MRLVAAALAAACLISTAAEAQTVASFSYIDTADNIDLTGQVLGSLSGNYFTVSGVSALTYNGQPVAFTPTYDGSVDYLLGYGLGYNGNGTAVITLDGSYMDWFVSYSADGFLFANGDIFAQHAGVPIYSSGVSFGDTVALFNPADWTLDVSVPEPGALALFGVGIGALAWLAVSGRRKAATRTVR